MLRCAPTLMGLMYADHPSVHGDSREHKFECLAICKRVLRGPPLISFLAFLFSSSLTTALFISREKHTFGTTHHLPSRMVALDQCASLTSSTNEEPQAQVSTIRVSKVARDVMVPRRRPSTTSQLPVYLVLLVIISAIVGNCVATSAYYSTSGA